MKKYSWLISLLLAGSVLMSSCGDIVISENSDGLEDEREDEEKQDDESTSDTNDHSSENSDSEAVTETESYGALVTDDLLDDDEGNYVAGVLNETGEYINIWRGHKYTPSDAEMLFVGDRLEMVIGASESDEIYDVMSFDMITQSSMNVCYVPIENEDYSTVFADIKSEFGSMVKDEFTINIAGTDYDGLKLTGNIAEGYTFEALMLCEYEGYIEMIMVMMPEESDIAPIVTRFTKINL